MSPSPSLTSAAAEPDGLAVAILATLDLTQHVTRAASPPVRIGEPMHGMVTHYGESYNGQVLGCGYGVYASGDPTIVAVSPALYAAVPCGTLLQVCGPGGCMVAARKDACPGCSARLFDLSESGFARVCGIPSGVCNASVQVVTTCGEPRLALPPPPPLQGGLPGLWAEHLTLEPVSLSEGSTEPPPETAPKFEPAVAELCGPIT